MVAFWPPNHNGIAKNNPTNSQNKENGMLILTGFIPWENEVPGALVILMS